MLILPLMLFVGSCANGSDVKVVSDACAWLKVITLDNTSSAPLKSIAAELRLIAVTRGMTKKAKELLGVIARQLETMDAADRLTISEARQVINQNEGVEANCR